LQRKYTPYDAIRQAVFEEKYDSRVSILGTQQPTPSQPAVLKKMGMGQQIDLGAADLQA
jgi:hypothetical protein